MPKRARRKENSNPKQIYKQSSISKQIAQKAVKTSWNRLKRGLTTKTAYGLIPTMKRQICKTCIHWKRDESYYPNYDYGTCSGMNDGDDVEIHIYAGWDGGGVDYVETKETFGCLHYEKE